MADEKDSLADWRQGDFSQDVGGFTFATVPQDELPFSVNEEIEGIWGLIVVSQTCDIVLETGRRQYVSVCPLIERTPEQAQMVLKGNPSLVPVEGTPDSIFADVSRVMSISKELLRQWTRQEGFHSDQTRRNFSAALERKFGRFAFPDSFNEALSGFRERVWKRHDKEDSPVGQIYRSIAEIRFAARPSWDEEVVEVQLIAILNQEDQRVAKDDDISLELNSQIAKVMLPEKYSWSDPPFLAAEPADFTAEDIIFSDRADFDFLCM
jgi:hypothetical protein